MKFSIFDPHSESKRYSCKSKLLRKHKIGYLLVSMILVVVLCCGLDSTWLAFLVTLELRYLLLALLSDLPMLVWRSSSRASASDQLIITINIGSYQCEISMWTEKYFLGRKASNLSSQGHKTWKNRWYRSPIFRGCFFPIQPWFYTLNSVWEIKGSQNVIRIRVIDQHSVDFEQPILRVSIKND